MIPVPPLLSRHYGEAGKERGGDDHVLPVIPAGRALGEERALTADSGGWGGSGGCGLVEILVQRLAFCRTCSAARLITAATSFGCDWKTTWLAPGISMNLLPARL